MKVFVFIWFIGCNTYIFFKFTPLGLLKSGKTNSVESLPELLTSDSEGSYAGVGSPRDLQSPDFSTAFHSDKIEVCFYLSINVFFP